MSENDEQLIRHLETELKKLKVADLLVQTLYTVSSLGYRKLSEEDRDLDQARLAIEALRALVPVLEGAVGEDVVRDFRQVTSNLQIAYADPAKGKAEEGYVVLMGGVAGVVDCGCGEVREGGDEETLRAGPEAHVGNGHPELVGTLSPLELAGRVPAEPAAA